MSQLRYNKLLPYLIPGSVIEIEGGGGGGDGIPPGCSWLRANFIRVDHEVSKTQRTELVYVATVKQRSTIIESTTGDSSSKVNLQLCRPEPPSENVNIVVSGQRIEFLMNELWMRGVIAKASGKNSFLVKLDDSSSDDTFEIKKSHIRRRKIWQLSGPMRGTWVLDQE